MTMLKRHKRIEKSKTPIEEIIAKTRIDDNIARRNIWIEGAVLALPLVVSFAFYVFTITNVTTKQANGTYLSPPQDIEALVVFIFAFILIYSVFLIFEYNHLKKKLDKYKKPKKHHRKK